MGMGSEQELSVRLKADGSGLVGEVNSGTAAIDKLGERAGQSSAQIERMNTQQRQLLQTFREQTTGIRGNSEAMGALDDELAQFMSKLSPAYNAVRQLDTGHDLLSRSLAAGLVTQKQYDEALARLQAKYGPAASGAAALAGGHSSLGTNTAFATREVRALFDELSSGRDRQAIGTATLLATRFTGIGLAGLGAVAGIAALFGTLALGAVTAEHNARALTDVELRFAATGRTGLVTRQNLQSMIDQMALLPGMSRASAQETLAALSTVPNISGPLYKNLAAIVDDFAHVTGQKAPQAAKTLAEAFADPAKGAQSLDKQLQLLTADQLLHIQSLERQGRVTEAQSALYAALETRIKGLHENAMTPLESSTEKFGHAWDGMMQRLANSDAVQGAINKLTALMNWMNTAEDKWRRMVQERPRTGLPDGETAGGAVTGRAGRGQLGVHAAPAPEQPAQLPWDAGMDLGAAMAAQATARQQADQAQIKSALEMGRAYGGVAAQLEELRDKAQAVQAALSTAFATGNNKSAAQLQRDLDGINEAMRRLGADNLLLRLQQKLASLIPLSTEVDRVTRELASGTEKHTEANKQQSLSIAAKIDKMELERRQIEALSKINLERAAAQDEQGKAYADAYNQNMAGLVDYNNRTKQVQIASITDSDARRKAQFDYEMRLEAEKLAVYQRNGVNMEMIQDAYAKFVVARQNQLNQDLRPEWQKMVDGWSDATLLMRSSVNSVAMATTRAGEDMVVQWRKTGQMSGKALGDAFLDEWMRALYRATIARPIAEVSAASTGSMLGLLGLGSSTPSSPGSTSGSTRAPVEEAVRTPVTAFANGGVMSNSGPMPLKKYANGGVANAADGPQLAEFAEAGQNEAFVPLPDGRSIPVTLQGGGRSGGGSVSSTNSVTVSAPLNITVNAPGAQPGVHAQVMSTLQQVMPGLLYQHRRQISGLVAAQQRESGRRS